MHSPDDKNYPLASAKRPPRPKRSVSKQDFKLPKPYRRQLFSEEPEGLTRLQIGMLGFGALLTATLIAVLALLAKESDHSPEGKVIVAAASLETVEPVDAHAAAVPALAVAAIPPALQEGARSTLPARASAPAPGRVPIALKTPVKAKTPTLLAVAPKKAPHARAVTALLAREKKRKPPRGEPVVKHPAPDPDVALITAILLLTPSPAPASTPAVAMELAGHAPLICPPATPKHSACTEVHMAKP